MNGRRAALIARGVVAASTLLGVSARVVPAQLPGREISVVAGIMQFDASGTGVEPTVAARVAAPILRRWLLTELSVGYAPLDEQGRLSPTRIGILEGQAQFQLLLFRFRPYVGIGGGWVRYFTNTVPGYGATQPTLSGSTGARIALSPRLGLRGELRVRGWGKRSSSGGFGYVNSAGEYTVGLAYAF